MALSDELEALAKRHGALSYRNRADTQHPAYGFTEGGLNGLIDEVLAKWAAPQPSPAAQGDALDAARQRACMELPKGMGIAIQLERDAGWIELHDSYNDQIKLPNADGSLAEQVHQAIDAARAAQKGKSHDN